MAAPAFSGGAAATALGSASNSSVTLITAPRAAQAHGAALSPATSASFFGDRLRLSRTCVSRPARQAAMSPSGKPFL